MIAASVRPAGDGTGLAVMGRELLFEGDYESMSSYDFTNYDVMPDDKHFVMLRVAGPAQTEIIMWMNWLPELRARMAATRR